MYLEIFKDLGLAKNEAEIYETLLMEGESSVGQISNKSGIHRRNVYDSTKRLLEKGLVFEIIDKNESRYRAVDPQKLTEILEEKQKKLSAVLPQLEALYKGTPRLEEVYIYRGIEGWKNYMRDILRLKEEVFTLGGMASWGSLRLQPFFEQFAADAQSAGVRFSILFDHGAKGSHETVATPLRADYRFLPNGYSTTVSVDIFADRVVILSHLDIQSFDEEASFTVIVNREIAEAFRAWFRLLWELTGLP